MKRYAFALDLVDDPNLIAEYDTYHQSVWPEIHASLIEAGIVDMTIYRFGNRLFMTMDVSDLFSLEQKNEMDLRNPKVQEWEKLMWKYQRSVPGAKPGEKWVLMNKIFEL
ncbi:L-rhamnose mutarotase [Sphingobacterium sp. FBM7-1]|uniref:L-rhamnose mutarotase n=1 Tax=Sphingobacterium sp. FBM7-1 TaxID=2886688 RepID=UPI001D126718|nr:L-rhamnose mutarotase [Sphingobacterium sp. FBM7-1]MCC2598331.1 L-rhamnose mutarotase [Sphingobacterium sp. FBM7-1]